MARDIPTFGCGTDLPGWDGAQIPPKGNGGWVNEPIDGVDTPDSFDGWFEAPPPTSGPDWNPSGPGGRACDSLGAECG